MNKTQINWGYENFYTWNPITGCRRGCSYCYARKLHEKRREALLKGRKLPEYYRVPFSEIQVHEERFYDKGLKRKKPRTIFVGSMSDIEYWPKEIMKHTVELCGSAQHHTFMFLSKDPKAYVGFKWPNNCILGLTLEGKEVAELQFHRINEMLCNYNRVFFSLEPLLGNLKIKLNDIAIERVIVGAMRGDGAVIPKKEWIQSIRDNVPEDKIFWKENIRKFL